MIEELAEEWLDKERNLIIEDFLTEEEDCFLSNIFKKIKRAYIDGYHECQKEHDVKCKTAYIKGIRTMANALKDYDRTNGAWTDYFEHTVEEVLKRLLKENESKSEMFPEITLPEESAEFVDKIISDAEKRLKESK